MEANGELPAGMEPELALRQVIMLTRGIMVEWMFREQQESIGEMSRQLFDVYFAGLLQK